MPFLPHCPIVYGFKPSPGSPKPAIDDCPDTSRLQENDEQLLELLEDVKITFSEKDPMGFTLHFHFAKNDFFTNSVLTKQVNTQPAGLVKTADFSNIDFSV